MTGFQAAHRVTRRASSQQDYAAARAELAEIWDQVSRALPRLPGATDEGLLTAASISPADTLAYWESLARLRAARAVLH
jgi:hypothetical protein